MPFGRYKDWPLDKVPEDYLQWAIDEIDFRSPQLRRAITRELESRASGYYSAQSSSSGRIAVPDAHRQFLKEILRLGFRAASLRHHPDTGGSGDAFRALHDAFEWLTERLEE
jgi:hypothetical protein